MADVFANNRSILHKGDGLQHVAAPPDVCKTPTPGGPVPLPYPNMAMSSALAKGTKKVKINGKSVATEAANLSMSSGDEPGTAGGGIISNKFKGKMTWGTSSGDVKFEGKGVARFCDVTQHNNNTYNTAFIALGLADSAVAYADDFTRPCEICGGGPKEHRIHSSSATIQKCNEIIARLTDIYNRLIQLELRTIRILADLPKGSPKRKKYNVLCYDKLPRARKRVVGSTGRGYMIAVMLCKCEDNPGFYAAKSGGELAIFDTIAKRAGCMPVHGNGIGNGAVSTSDLMASNQSGGNTARIAKVIGIAWKKAEEKKEKGIFGYTPVGTCAAMKLMTKAGHAILQMTEMFFEPTGNSKGQVYDWYETRAITVTGSNAYEYILQNVTARYQRGRRFAVGAEVGSCHTCQSLLYMGNCPVRNCPTSASPIPAV